jgi:predicted dinucleotide-binding enzyme
MRLAIIGAGNVGGALGTAWAQKAGHEIFFGVKNPTSDLARELVRRLGGKAQAGALGQAPSFARVWGLMPGKRSWLAPMRCRAPQLSFKPVS